MTSNEPSLTDDYWSAVAARRHVSLRRLVAPGPDAAQLQRIVEGRCALSSIIRPVGVAGDDDVAASGQWTEPGGK